MPRGRTKTRFTVAVDAGLAKALDARTRSRELTRSAAVEEALICWLRLLADQEGEDLDRLGSGPGRSRSEASEARIAAVMVLEAMRHQFPAMQDVSDTELRRRVLAKSAGSRNGT